MKETPLIRSLPAALIAAAVLVLPVVLTAMVPDAGIYAVLFVLFLLPVGSCVAEACGGLVPALATLLCGVLAVGRVVGVDGLWLSGVYVAAVFVAYLFVNWKKTHFFKACGIMILVHMMAFCLAYVYMQRLFDNQLYQAAGQATADYIKSLPECDMLLIQFHSSGFIGLADELKNQVLVLPNGLFGMTDVVRQDMLLSVSALTEELLQGLMPMVLVQHSILSGVGCLLLSRRFGFLCRERRLAKEPERQDGAPRMDMNMPPLSLWHLPRGLGWKVGLAWVLGSFLRLNANQTIMVAGAILYYAANAVFIWQGAALLNFTQKAKGTKRIWRVVMPCLFFVLGILSYLGIFDQIINLRGLRKPPEPKEDI